MRNRKNPKFLFGKNYGSLSQIRIFFYHELFWVLSGVGIYLPPLYGFHLLDLAMRSDLIQNVLQAVTQNAKSIVLTALLAVIVIYIYAVIGFFFINSSYTAAGLDCATIYQCFFTTLVFGVENGGGIGGWFSYVPWSDTSLFFGRFFFDFTFYILIILLILNMVFGIIVNTFGALRDARREIEDDMNSKCFICSIGSEIFQRQALGFEHHIKYEHDPWKYIDFFVYLDLKNDDEYTFAEEYVARKRAANENDYFPINRAICLEKYHVNSEDKSE